MFNANRRLSASKLKTLSNILGCSFSSLRSTLLIGSSHGNRIQLSCKSFSYIKNLSLFLSKTYSTAQQIEDPYSNIDYELITKGDKDLLKKFKVIILEVDVMRQEGQRVPSRMTDDRWIELLSMQSRAQRMKLLAFWWLNEKKKEKDKRKKEESRIRREEGKDEHEEKKNTDHIYYGFGGSTIFTRVYDSTIDHYMNCGLVQAMMYGQDLVIDCGYDAHMNHKEASYCANQLTLAFAENRQNREPFNIHYCNVKREDQVTKKWAKSIPKLFDNDFPVNVTGKNYLDLFPKEKLVYLTPHCKEVLKEFSHHDIYIIGAMVDKVNNDPLSLAKAKSQGLRMAKFPLDRYLDWGIGTKSLTINQVLYILLELKATGDWNTALKHVPMRKLKNEQRDERRSKYSYEKKRRVSYR